jgi:hypothetical protein
MKILGLPGFGTTGYTPVPYDFDYCGLVNASYAIPGGDLGIESVTDRYFLGICRADESYGKTMDRIAGHREEMLQLVNDFQYLSSKHKKEMIGYLESYFIEASSQDFISDELRRTCR